MAEHEQVRAEMLSVMNPAEDSEAIARALVNLPGVNDDVVETLRAAASGGRVQTHGRMIPGMLDIGEGAGRDCGLASPKSKM